MFVAMPHVGTAGPQGMSVDPCMVGRVFVLVSKHVYIPCSVPDLHAGVGSVVLAKMCPDTSVHIYSRVC
jgi:hypothetical protein